MGLAAPCGVCGRQVMAEFCGPEFKILLVTGKNRWETHTLGGLLPLAFGGGHDGEKVKNSLVFRGKCWYNVFMHKYK